MTPLEQCEAVKAELLAALTALVSRIHDGGDTHHRLIETEFQRELQAAQDAIAKATGARS